MKGCLLSLTISNRFGERGTKGVTDRGVGSYSYSKGAGVGRTGQWVAFRGKGGADRGVGS
jgi:hypothetical protein